jgi:four helix bundle protein
MNYDLTKEQLKECFKQYAINVAFFVLKLPNNIVNKKYSDKLDRDAPQAAANYRASLRAKSNPDFLNKFKIAEEELDELLFFVGLIGVVHPSYEKPISPIYTEGSELLSIIVASLNTLRKKQTNRKSSFVSRKWKTGQKYHR